MASCSASGGTGTSISRSLLTTDFGHASRRPAAALRKKTPAPAVGVSPEPLASRRFLESQSHHQVAVNESGYGPSKIAVVPTNSAVLTAAPIRHLFEEERRACGNGVFQIFMLRHSRLRRPLEVAARLNVAVPLALSLLRAEYPFFGPCLTKSRTGITPSLWNHPHLGCL